MIRNLSLWLAAGVAWAAEPSLLHVGAIGHEFRQDDCPSIAAGPDGSVWAVWLSFDGQRDDLAIRRFHEGKWGTMQWVPGTSGDSWLPQILVDAAGRPWVIWSQQVDGNWDLYARWFDPGKQQWGPLERLTTDPLPDINPRVFSDCQGRAALVWQGFRGGFSNIFLRIFEGQRFTPEVRVTRTAANDWEPAVALDAQGVAWVVYDSYRNGNYDVFLARVRAGALEGPELAVAATARFEARPTVAVDSNGRVWVAFEEGPVNWGKDQGYIIRERQTGAMLGGRRSVQVRCYSGAAWRAPSAVLPQPFRDGYAFQPHLFADGRGSLWLVAKLRRVKDGPPPELALRAGYQPLGQRGYWEYWLTRLEGPTWSEAVALPSSRGRTSTRVHAALDPAANLWLVWPTDNRTPDNPHRPIRGQVYAAMLSAPAPARGVTLEPVVSDLPRINLAHADEPGDVKAVRSYVTVIAGRKHRLVRGDLHRHTELSWDISASSDGSLQDFYRYMLDVAAMDFGASTDHQGGAWPYWWWYTQKMTDMHHVPGAYVALYGYERSTAFPFGHRNVFFARRAEARVTPFFMRPGTQGFTLPPGPQGDEPPVGTNQVVENDTPLLWEDIRGRNAIAIPHTSGNRMGTDWRFYDPELEPVVEIFQGCRTSFEQLGAPYVAREPEDAEAIKVDGFQPEGMVSNAWQKGYRLGTIASSDHFSTHISYAMVFTADFTRQGILEAIRRRHTYAATDNIVLEVRMGNYFMGDRVSASKPLPISVKARGTAAVTRLDIIRDARVIYSAQPGARDVSLSFMDTAPGAGRHYYYVRLLQADGMIAWSSPFFVNW